MNYKHQKIKASQISETASCETLEKKYDSFGTRQRSHPDTVTNRAPTGLQFNPAVRITEVDVDMATAGELAALDASIKAVQAQQKEELSQEQSAKIAAVEQNILNAMSNVPAALFTTEVVSDMRAEIRQIVADEVKKALEEK